MDQKSLKTSLGQRIIMIVVAVLLVGATFLTYLFVVMNNGGSSRGNSAQNSNIDEIADAYNAKVAELEELMAPISEKYFKEFSKYLSEVKAYNAAAVNNARLEVKDLKVGTGKTLTEGDTDYAAFFVGWCADGSIFSSALDKEEDPTGFAIMLEPSTDLIAGWKEGVVGMKIGGVRQLSIAGELAYGEDEICGGTNSPLRFLVMAVDAEKEIFAVQEEVQNLQLQLYYAYYGNLY